MCKHKCENMCVLMLTYPNRLPKIHFIECKFVANQMRHLRLQHTLVQSKPSPSNTLS